MGYSVEVRSITIWKCMAGQVLDPTSHMVKYLLKQNVANTQHSDPNIVPPSENNTGSVSKRWLAARLSVRYARSCWPNGCRSRAAGTALRLVGWAISFSNATALNFELTTTMEVLLRGIPGLRKTFEGFVGQSGVNVSICDCSHRRFKNGRVQLTITQTAMELWMIKHRMVA